MNQCDEIFIIAQEECAEIIQAISKIQRFGFNEDNKDRLSEEIGDFMCMFMLMIEKEMLSLNDIENAINKKREKLKKWSTIKDL
jgi:NTP pyrophosphatase (non-canonical NTP hydrolase)